jgi:pilus assembly protein CpaC
MSQVTSASSQTSTNQNGALIHKMSVGETLTLKAQNTNRVAVGNGAIIQVDVLKDTKEVLAIAKAPGITDLVIWNRKGLKEQHIIRVEGNPGGPTAKQLKGLLKHTQGITIQPIGNTFLLEGTAKTQQQFERLKLLATAYPNLLMLAFPPPFEHKPTVLLHAQFLEVKRNALDKVGVSWASIINGPNFTFDNNYSSTSFSSSLSSVINLLKNNGDAQLLAEPTLSCISGGSAKFLAGGEIPIPFVGDDGQITVTFKEFGIKLDIRPIVDDEDYIQTEVNIEVSSVDPSVSVRGVPGFLSRRASTIMNGYNGQTVVLAGLFSKEESKSVDKMPGAGDIPILGELFKSRDFRNSESELVVLITPRIIKSPVEEGQRGKDLLRKLGNDSEDNLKFRLMD